MNNTTTCNILFIYGTLKSNEPNYGLTKKLISENKIKYIGKGLLKDKRPLIVASDFNIPYILDYIGKGHQIKGELYEFLDLNAIQELDALEKHPVHYTREVCDVIYENNNQIENIKCWVYLLKNFQPFLLDYETTDEYHDGIFGKMYVLAHQRSPNAIRPMDFVKLK